MKNHNNFLSECHNIVNHNINGKLNIALSIGVPQEVPLAPKQGYLYWYLRYPTPLKRRRYVVNFCKKGTPKLSSCHIGTLGTPQEKIAAFTIILLLFLQNSSIINLLILERGIPELIFRVCCKGLWQEM